MDSFDLKRLHKALILITSEIDRICKKNNIIYSLTGGSMIGAVRHKGIIPWDDDVDIAMLRSEYDFFLEVCKSELAPEFELQTLDNDPNYMFGFAKIVLRDTYLVQYGHEKTRHRKGIYVDVFPLDNVPDDFKQRKVHKMLNYLLVKLLFRKAGCQIESNKTLGKIIIFSILDFINLFAKVDILKKVLIYNMKRFNDFETQFVCNMAGYYGYEKETTRREYFENVVDMSFEGKQYSVSIHYDDFLSSVYGDYMKLPPENQRHTHEFQNLDFGIYKNL